VLRNCVSAIVTRQLHGDGDDGYSVEFHRDGSRCCGGGEFHGDENKCGNPVWMETRVAGLSQDVKEKQKQRRILS